MTRVTKDGNCGNSPKNELLQAFCIAAARKDLELIEALMADDVAWHPVGRKPVAGSEAVARAITKHCPASALHIEHVITHGRAGSVDGIIEFGNKRRAFCHVFEFSNAKGDRIRSIRTFTLPVT